MRALKFSLLYGPVKDENIQQCGTRTKKEREDLYNHPNFVKIIEAQILESAGHVRRSAFSQTSLFGRSRCGKTLSVRARRFKG